MKNQLGLRGVRRLLKAQSIVSALLAMGFLVLNGSQAAWSALLGGLVSALPNAYFAKKLFQHQGAHAARKIVTSFYQGEAVKILVSMLLFSLVFMFCHVIPWVFLLAYIGVQMVMWFAPIIFVDRPIK